MKTKFFSAILILIVFVASNSSFAHAANSSITTVISSEDSYIDSTQPTANFGGGVTMWIRGGTSTQRGLLRFNLSAIPANAQIISAILKLSVSTDGSPVAGNVNSVIGSWAENTVTYSTAPQVGALIAALPNPASPSSSVSIDITSYITGKTTADLYITSLNGDGVRYYTHEKGTTKSPQLLITWTVDPAPTSTVALTKTSTSIPTMTTTPPQTPINTWTPSLTQTSNLPTLTITTPAPNTTLTFTPTADTYVQTDFPSSGFGSSTQIVVDNSPVRNLLLKFALSGIGTQSVLSAKLRLYCVDGSPFGGEFHRAADTGWSEGTVSWNNAPSADPGSVATLGKVVASTWYEVDVTSLVSGDGIFGLRVLSTSTDGAYYSSKEGTAGFAPQLVITTSASMSTATATPVNPATVTSTPTSVPTAGPTNMFTPSPSGVPTQVLTKTLTPGLTPAASPTSPATESDPIIMAAGDFICDSLTTSSTACQQMAASQVVVDQMPAAALILGDLCHTPSANCFNNYYAPSWGRLFPISHPITGNHEYLVTGAIYYFDYWNGVGNADGPAGNRSQGYYSYDIGSWHIIALNSQCSQAGGCNAGSPQYIWLQQDLQNHTNLCTLAYYHIPVFSSGGRANNNMKQIYTLLYNNNVEIVLNGHDHIYERFAPQDPNGLADPSRGIREFIVGTGGANHTSIATIQPNSEVRNVDTFGALKLTLHSAGYDWQFMPVPGKTFTDSGTASCH
jgi:calcineurin-like phosphoesterase family protein